MGVAETSGLPLESAAPTDASVLEPTLEPIVSSSSASTNVMDDSAILGKSTIVRDIELERMTKLMALAEVADKHLVEITTPEGVSIKPMRATLQQVQTIQDAKVRRQRQSRVLVCNLQ